MKCDLGLLQEKLGTVKFKCLFSVKFNKKSKPTKQQSQQLDIKFIQMNLG